MHHWCGSLFLDTIQIWMLSASIMHQPVQRQCITQIKLKKEFLMPRVTVTLPQDLHKKLSRYAGDNDDSLSYTITKMTEIGLMVTESQQNQKSPEDKFSDIEKHCFKLMIQMNALLKNMASKQMDYGQDEFKKLMDLSIGKYHELMGIAPEEL